MKDDLSGKNRLMRNLFSGWLFHALQLVSGFILPRLISDRLGQGSLGVWDFGWAVVSYFALLQGDIVSSVNCYVAKYRTVGDSQGLNVAVNSVGTVLKVIAALIAVLSCVLAWYVPRLMTEKLAGLTSEATWVVLLLGLTAAVQVQGAIYGGVLTGCHRWTVHNGIKGLAAVIGVGGGVAVVLLGGTIVWLSGVMLVSEIVLRVAQRIASSRACPELVISVKYFSKAQTWEMCRFGGKSYVSIVGQMLVNQTSSVLVASTLGVNALAVFARPRALVRAVSSLVDRNASVIVPVVSALDAAGRLAEIRDLAIAASRYAVYACLPVLLVLLCLGSDVLRLWMGDAYVDPLLLGIFAVAGLFEAMCLPLFRMLMGMNRHGRLGLLNLAVSVLTVAFVALAAFGFQDSLRWIAVAVAVPSMVVNAVLLPAIAARVLQIQLLDMMREVWIKPLWCCLPAALALVATSLWFHGSAIQRLALGLAAAAAASGFLYWKHAVPEKLKSYLGRLTGRAPRPPTATTPAPSPR